MTKWLDRSVAYPGPYLCLCLNDAEYRKACKDLKYVATEEFPKAGAHVVCFNSPDGQAACVVCVNVEQDATPVDLACLMVHEAVHVWQHHCAAIGERNPGEEQEAYAIQWISSHLMNEYVERLKKIEKAESEKPVKKVKKVKYPFKVE